MPSKKRKEEVVDNNTVPAVIEPTDATPLRTTQEKVEVLIKETVRIRARDFEAFMNAFEDFVKNWE